MSVDQTWHIMVPLSFITGAVLIIGSLIHQHYRDRKWRKDIDLKPRPDERDWHGAFMKDMKQTPPRSWR